jgi:polar amino acid transport system substrate-binding protein
LLLAALYFSPVEADTQQDQVRLITAHLLPYSIQGGAQPGFMIELVEEIERRLGSDRQIKYLPWPRSLRLVKREPNHIIFPLTRTPEREEHYIWAIKVAPIEMVFVTLDGKSLSMAQARELESLSVQQDTPFEQFLKRNGFDNLISLPDAAPLHIRLLQVKRTQAWFTAKDLARYAWLEQRVQEPLVLGDSVYRSDVYIATSRQFPSEVASAYRRAFDVIVRDGGFAAIMQRYQR